MCLPPEKCWVDCFRVWTLNRKKDLLPAVDFDILGIIKLSNGQSFEIVADVEDYNAIRARSSTEELSHSGLYK